MYKGVKFNGLKEEFLARKGVIFKDNKVVSVVTGDVIGTLNGEPVLFLSWDDKEVIEKPMDTPPDTKMIWSMLLKGFVVRMVEPIVPMSMAAPVTGEIEELLHDLVCYVLEYGDTMEYKDSNTLEKFVLGSSNISVYTDDKERSFEIWKDDRAMGPTLVALRVHRGEYVYSISTSHIPLIKELWLEHIGSKKQ